MIADTLVGSRSKPSSKQLRNGSCVLTPAHAHQSILHQVQDLGGAIADDVQYLQGAPFSTPSSVQSRFHKLAGRTPQWTVHPRRQSRRRRRSSGAFWPIIMTWVNNNTALRARASFASFCDTIAPSPSQADRSSSTAPMIADAGVRTSWLTCTMCAVQPLQPSLAVL